MQALLTAASLATLSQSGVATFTASPQLNPVIDVTKGDDNIKTFKPVKTNMDLDRTISFV
jgi:hypothetical protein